MNQHLSLERLGLLMRADLVARYRLVLITTVTLAILIIVRGVGGAYFTDSADSIFGGWFNGMLFIAGPIVASYSFKELHDKSRNEAYLLLPASALEKMLARLLLVTLMFGAYVVFFLYAISWINAAINFMVYGQRVALFHLADFKGYILLAHALVLQSIFFLGAAWFQKSHLIKTSFAITVLIVGIFIVTILIARIGFGDSFWRSIRLNAELYYANRDALHFLKNTASFFYFVLLPPFCWWVSWLRIKETQVSHGV